MKLKGKVILITGASKGIGKGIALEAAREGADVIVNYMSDEPGAKAVVKDIHDCGRDAIAVQADVGCKKNVDALFEQGLDHFGKIDLLVNNAGIALWKPFIELDEKDWNRTLDINLKGVFLCSQSLAKHLIKRKSSGSIVNISSIAAAGALDCLVPYCASKGGMTLITKAIGMELAPYGIRINALAPGTIDIKRNRETDKDYPEDWVPYIPLGRVGNVRDIARPVIFLLSEDADYITGQTFWADGGETCYVPMPRADFAR